MPSPEKVAFRKTDVEDSLLTLETAKSRNANELFYSNFICKTDTVMFTINIFKAVYNV